MGDKWACGVQIRLEATLRIDSIRAKVWFWGPARYSTLVLDFYKKLKIDLWRPRPLADPLALTPRPSAPKPRRFSDLRAGVKAKLDPRRSPVAGRRSPVAPSRAEPVAGRPPWIPAP